mmetsp:Transcript_79516/g.199962  ORF Transcript_79516/g.199962 Transcript_79516/m.199962 type:complete len:213 (+) Transcript_79516:239-877(+)
MNTAGEQCLLQAPSHAIGSGKQDRKQHKCSQCQQKRIRDTSCLQCQITLLLASALVIGGLRQHLSAFAAHCCKVLHGSNCRLSAARPAEFLLGLPCAVSHPCVRQGFPDNVLNAHEAFRCPHRKAGIHCTSCVELLVPTTRVCHEAHTCTYALSASTEPHVADEHRDTAAAQDGTLRDVALDAHPTATKAQNTAGCDLIGKTKLFPEDPLQP